MGLDMYLYKCEPIFEPHLKKTKHTFEEVMYWRKAYGLHNWFVENCGNGVEGLDMYEVSAKKLKELIDKCYYLITHREEISNSEFSIWDIKEILGHFEELETSDGWFVYMPSY